MVAATLLLGGCTVKFGVTTPSATPTDQVAAIELPGTSVGDRAAWLIEIFNNDEDAVAEQFDGVFADVFLNELSIEEFVDLTNTQIRPMRPFAPVEFDEEETSGVVLLDTPKNGLVLLELSLQPGDLVMGVFVRPAPEP